MASPSDVELVKDSLYRKVVVVGNYADFTLLLLKLPRSYRKDILTISAVIGDQGQSHFLVIEKFRNLAKKVNRDKYREYANKSSIKLEIEHNDFGLHDKLCSNYDGFSESDKNDFLSVIRFLIYYDCLYKLEPQKIKKTDRDRFQEFINIMGNIVI